MRVYPAGAMSRVLAIGSIQLPEIDPGAGLIRAWAGLIHRADQSNPCWGWINPAAVACLGCGGVGSCPPLRSYRCVACGRLLNRVESIQPKGGSMCKRAR
eukprot:3403104-Prymnesium_polylepis.1